MNYTEHYQLNQWEPTDRVLREDFNEDNRKIEAAIAACAMQNAQLLKSITLSEDLPRFEIDMGDINFNAWHAVVLRLELIGEGSVLLCTNQTYSEFFNQFSVFETTSDCLSQFPVQSAGQCHEIYLFPLCDQRRLITALTLSETILLGRNYALTYQNLTTLILSPKESGQTIGHGSKISVYGLHL